LSKYGIKIPTKIHAKNKWIDEKIFDEISEKIVTKNKSQKAVPIDKYPFSHHKIWYPTKTTIYCIIKDVPIKITHSAWYVENSFAQIL